MQAGRRYEILSLLGQGGFGAVYRAKMVGEGGFTKEVALKILRPELASSQPFAQRLRDEARLLALVRHRAIIQVDALLELDGRWTMVMELVQGPDLKITLDHGPLPLGPALELGAEVAGALHAGWTTPGPDDQPLQLLHRDIKPANLCLTRLGEVKVLDFGLSRALGSPREGETTDGTFGTPEYMAPERFALENGPAADVYALGATLFETLTAHRLGRALLRPFHHASMVHDRLLTCAGPAGELHQDLTDLLSAMLAFAPENRPDAREVERQLVRLRRRLDGLSLKDWAEQVLPAVLLGRTRDRDASVGSVFYEQGAPRADRASRGWGPLSAAVSTAAETWLLPEGPPRPPSSPASNAANLSTVATAALSRSVGASRTRQIEGREELLDDLAVAASAAAAGEAQIILLVGEAGIGKTRLAEEGARRAAQDGFGVTWGRCWEAGEAPAGWPWSEALGRIHAEDPRASQRLSPQQRAALSALLPDLDAPAAPARSPEEARNRLGQAILSYLEAAGEDRPWWIVLDDLHAVDPLSLFLLRSVGRGLGRARVVLACTWRDAEVATDPELSRGLAELSRRALHVAMPRLDRAATERLIARLLPGATPETVDALWQSTLGQPLFVHEMARIVQSRGPDALLAANIPAGVREAVRLRMERLPQPTRDLLEAAALIGPSFEAGLLAEVEGQPEREVLRQLSLGERMNVLERSSAGHRFSHPLIRRAFEEPIDPTRRAMLHCSIAQALERRPGSPAALLARHWRQAGQEHALASTNAAIRASQEALSHFAWEEAWSAPQQARAALAGRAPALEARLLIQEGLVRVRLGEVADGRARALRAAELARSLDEPTLLGEAALAYGGDVIEGAVDDTLVSLLREVLAALPAEQSALRARLLARLAGATQPAPDPFEPVSLAREALGVPVADPRARLEILVCAVSAMVEQVPPEEYLSYNQEALSLAHRLREGTLRLRLLLRLVGNWWEIGDMPQTRAQLAAYAGAVEEAGLPAHRRRLHALRAGMAWSAGERARSEQLYRETIQQHQEAGDQRRAGILAMIDAIRRWTFGEREAAIHWWLQLLERARTQPESAPHPFLVEAGAAPCLMAAGRREEAQAMVDRLLQSPSIHTFGNFGGAILSGAALAVGHLEGARHLYHRLLPWRGCVTGAPAFLGAVGEPMTLILGRLAHAGAIPGAIEHLEAAERWCRRAEARVTLASLLPDLAAARRTAGLHAQAQAAEAEGARLATEIGIVAAGA